MSQGINYRKHDQRERVWNTLFVILALAAYAALFWAILS
jgi:hypothetical protein